MTNEIVIYLIALVPSIASVVSALGTAIGILKQFKALRGEVKQKTEMKDLKEKLEIVISENRDLKQMLKKDIETRTHIRED